MIRASKTAAAQKKAAKRVAAKLAAATAPGEIRADAVYSRDEFLARTKIGSWAFTTAKRNGLRTADIGGRAYVRGEAWLDYVRRLES